MSKVLGLDKKDTGTVLRWITILMVLLTTIVIVSFTYIITVRPEGWILPGMVLRWSMFGAEVNGVKILEMNNDVLLGLMLLFGIPLGLLFLTGVPLIFFRSLHASGEYKMFRDAKKRLNFIIRHGSRREKGVVAFVIVSFTTAYVYLLLLALDTVGKINWVPLEGLLFFFVLLNTCLLIVRRVIH
ncbi:MAG: hypothetical protein ACTSUQ_13885 [Candidatus Freyarchaeota archaeon]